MSKQLPFEESDGRWSDGPLPDADAAWRDMSALLDKDERKAPPVLPPFLPGCAGWTLVLLVAALGAPGYYWYRSTRPTSPPTAVGQSASFAQGAGKLRGGSASQQGSKAGASLAAPDSIATTGSGRRSAKSEGGPSLSANKKGPGKAPAAPATGAAVAANNRRKRPTGTIFQNKPVPAQPGGPVAGNGNTAPRSTPAGAMPGGSKTPVLPAPDVASQPGAPDGPIVPANTAGTPKPPATIAADTSAKAAPPVAAKSGAEHPAQADSTLQNTMLPLPPKPAARHAPRLSAGVGISLPIPIGGQEASAANYGGHDNPFTEHVPSAWLRARKGRWFLQGELRFNAPQLLPTVAFAQKTRFDTAGHSVVTERRQLRKAWYHQFPLTVNYQALPRWSVGAGAQWSVLYRAAGERISYRRDLANNLSLESAVPFQVPGYRDSFLYQAQWQLVLQTEFGWRRWGLGLRYRSDLQPYLRYTRPGGELADVHNEAFEATVRFRLWQSKRRN